MLTCQLHPYCQTWNIKKIKPLMFHWNVLTHWGRTTHICIGNLTVIGSDNGLSPGHYYITNFNEISIGIQAFSFKKMHFKMSSAKWRPFGLGLNELKVTELAAILSQPQCVKELYKKAGKSCRLLWVIQYMFVTSPTVVRFYQFISAKVFLWEFYNPYSHAWYQTRSRLVCS